LRFALNFLRRDASNKAHLLQLLDSNFNDFHEMELKSLELESRPNKLENLEAPKSDK